jgi:tetratricopeptide (TPR) repeat protein
LLLLSSPVRADQDASARDASRHFQRGVELYNDGDYRGALVEFKKAYALLPRSNVLYDIGETEYQLQDYPAALKTMERFLAETGPGTPHRAEVEETVEILKGRIGRLALLVDSPGCEVSVDDQVVGTTPLGRALAVSVGSRRIAVNCPGRPMALRRVEIAGGETVRVDIRVGRQPEAPHPALAAPSDNDRKPKSTSNTLAWTVTGLLGAATIAVYTSALVESNELGELKRQFPANRDAIEHKANLTTALAIGGDALAATTAVALGFALYWTLTTPDEHKLHVGVSWNGIAVVGRF